jgi:type I restriction enzyme, S subunit
MNGPSEAVEREETTTTERSVPVRSNSFREPAIPVTASVPQHWTTIRLKYLAAIAYGLAEPPPYHPAGTAFIRATNVQRGKIVENGLVFVHKADLSGKGAVYLRAGDIIVVRSGAYTGDSALVTKEWAGALLGYDMVLRPKPNVDPAYIAASLLSFPVLRAQIDPLRMRAAQPHLNSEELGEVVLSIPALHEQRAIASFLGRELARIDDLIAKNERLIDLLEANLRSFVYRETLGEWRISEITGSRTTRLREVATILQTGPFGSQLHADDYVDDGVPIVNPSNIADQEIIPDQETGVSLITAARLARHRLEPLDIVFARRGEMGRCGIVQEHQAGWLCGTGSLLVRLKLERVNPCFLIEYLGTTYVAEYLQQHSVGSTMNNLNTSIIGRLPVPLPHLDVQKQIALRIHDERASTRSLRRVAIACIDKLREYRTALISAAVTGQIDVHTYRKEPEAVLETA